MAVGGGVGQRVRPGDADIHRPVGRHGNNSRTRIAGRHAGIGERRAEFVGERIVSVQREERRRLVAHDDAVGRECFVGRRIGHGDDDDVGSERQRGVVRRALREGQRAGQIGGENKIRPRHVGHQREAVGICREHQVGEAPQNRRRRGVADDDGARNGVGVAIAITGLVSERVRADDIHIHHPVRRHGQNSRAGVAGGRAGVGEPGPQFVGHQACAVERDGGSERVLHRQRGVAREAAIKIRNRDTDGVVRQVDIRERERRIRRAGNGRTIETPLNRKRRGAGGGDGVGNVAATFQCAVGQRRTCDGRRQGAGNDGQYSRNAGGRLAVRISHGDGSCPGGGIGGNRQVQREIGRIVVGGTVHGDAAAIDGRREAIGKADAGIKKTRTTGGRSQQGDADVGHTLRRGGRRTTDELCWRRRGDFGDLHRIGIRRMAMLLDRPEGHVVAGIKAGVGVIAPAPAGAPAGIAGGIVGGAAGGVIDRRHHGVERVASQPARHCGVGITRRPGAAAAQHRVALAGNHDRGHPIRFRIRAGGVINRSRLDQAWGAGQVLQFIPATRIAPARGRGHAGGPDLNAMRRP